MSAFKGTPGPWHEYANRQRRPYIAGADGALVAFIESDDDVEDANSALISAAPDLLEALIDARKQLEAYEEALNGEDYNSPKINAAIAKATGEQP